MTSDQVEVVLIAAGWSGAVGACGFLAAVALRRRSLRWLPLVVAVVAVLAVVAGVVGTSRAMFLSDHDYAVVLLVLLVAGLVALAVAAAVGAWMVRSSRALQAEARRFGQSGRFESSHRGPTELAELAAELERTSDRLREAHESEARIEESRRELVAWVSHDLRTPLAGLRAMAEALEDGMVGDPDRYHRQMRAEVDRMVRMVDDLFELSRIHAGALSLSLETVPLGDLVSEAIAGADPVARRRGVRLGGRVDDGLEVRADPAGLSRVIANLVMNAIRHTPADGVVEIVGHADAGRVELSVTDGCGGIPEEDLPRIFDVAFRGGTARTPEDQRGAGLGLAIVKGIVEAHDGSVVARNETGGCRFLVSLPA